MGVGDFVRNGIGATMIARPGVGRNHVSYKYQLGVLPAWGQLEVGDHEAAVFRRYGAVLGALGPGRHTLSPTSTPFLERTKTSDGAGYDCEVVFVTTGPTRLMLEGTIEGVVDTAGERVPFTFLGSVVVRAADPVRVVAEGIGVGEAGEGFDRIVCRRVMNAVQEYLPGVLESGLADPSNLATIGPELVSVGAGDGLGLRVFGLEPVSVEVMRLGSSSGRAPAGADASARRAEAEAAAELPSAVSCRFGVPRMQFWDTRYEMAVRVSAIGHFEGEPIPPQKEQWLEELIVHTMRQAATTWTGTVLELPNKVDDWARYVTKVVAPQLTHHTGLRGRVVIDGVEIDRDDHAELRRRARPF